MVLALKLNVTVLNAGKTFEAYNKVIGPFEENKVVYIFRSEEFGSFEVASVMNPSKNTLRSRSNPDAVVTVKFPADTP